MRPARRLLCLLLALPLWIGASPFIFQQTQITITALGPKPGTVARAPATEAGKQPAPVQPIAPQPRQFTLRAQLRPADALQQRDLFSVDPFAHTQAHLFVFEKPTLTAFQAPHIQKAVDLLAVNANGIIQEIVPQAIPATLDPEKYAVEEPVRALILLPAGSVDANGLRPGDHVANAIFSRPPEKRN